MKAQRLSLIAVCLWLAGPRLSAESPSDRAGWWIEHYGAVEAAEVPRFERARAVFDRVLAAADKNGKRFPRLVILREKAGPFALALPDGSVLLTPGAIDLCYRSAPAGVGEARLAFVLGHELAHLAKDDFWHGFAPGAGASESEPPERTRQKELQADSYGLLYMTMAGYLPEAVLRQQAAFLEEWGSQVASLATPEGASHPAAQERASGIRKELSGVVDQLDLFRTGVRLMQLERYEDALLFLEPFQERFPSREIFNDVGVCHYQLALRALASCDPDAAFRFRLAARLDPTTRVPRLSLRGAESGCPARPLFERHIQEALRRLEHATEADPAYGLAPLNLASALIVNGQPAQALAAAESALKVAPESVDALNTKAVALYLYGGQAGIETTDFALRILTELREKHPEDRASAFNLARLLDERGRAAAAQEAWESFLKSEPEGAFAELARRRLHRDPAPEAKPRETPAARPPIPLGKLSRASEKTLQTLKKRPLELGGVAGVLYRGERMSALELDYSLEIVEEDIAPRPLAEILASYGPPLREVEGSGSRTLVYRGLAFDVADGRAVRRIFFSR